MPRVGVVVVRQMNAGEKQAHGECRKAGFVKKLVVVRDLFGSKLDVQLQLRTGESQRGLLPTQRDRQNLDDQLVVLKVAEQFGQFRLQFRQLGIESRIEAVRMVVGTLEYSSAAIR